MVVLGAIVVVVAPSDATVAVVVDVAAVPVPLHAATTNAKATVALTSALNPIRTPYD